MKVALLISLLTFASAIHAEASSEPDPGGVTFDFQAISDRRFASGGEVIRVEGRWGELYHIHTYDLKDDDPIRTAAKSAVHWSQKGGICRVEKTPDLLGLVGGSTNFVKATDGSFKKLVKLPDAEGGTYRLRFNYRIEQRDLALRGRSCVLYTPYSGGKAGSLRNLWLSTLPGEWPLFCKNLSIPKGMDEVELWIRIDGVGSLAFRDVTLEKLPEKEVEIRFMASSVLDNTFAIPKDQPGYLAFEWRRRPEFKADISRAEFRLSLPKGVRFLGSNFGDRGTYRTVSAADGSSVTTFRLRKGRYLSPSWNTWRKQGLILGTDRASGTLGEGVLELFLDGRCLAATERTTFLAISGVKAAAVPAKFMNGAVLGTGPDGLFFDFDDEALSLEVAKAMTAAGLRLMVSIPPKKVLDQLHADGVKVLGDTVRISNGYHIGDHERAPADERFVPVKPRGAGTYGDGYVTNSPCPSAVIARRPFFENEAMKEVGAMCRGLDGFWGNWEPHMFGGGCACAKCREAAKEWTNGDDTKLPAFRSWQHGQVVRAADRKVREFTGGNRSMGLMAGVGWLEAGSYHHDHNLYPEWKIADYAADVEWLQPWGPYAAWEIDTPYLYDKGKPLAHFLAAKDIRETIDRDFPLPKRPKLASFPHGMQGSNWVTQPEHLSMSLDAFFFNRFEANIVYFFPQGYDARYWAGFARATERAAKYERFVFEGRRVDDLVTAEPLAAVYAAKVKCATAFLPRMTNEWLLQSAAYELEGRRIVAVLNFWKDGEAWFDLKARGLGAGRYALVDEDGVLYTKSGPEQTWTAAELSGGVRLQVGAVRTKVFELVSLAEGAPLPAAKRTLTREELDRAFRSREPVLRGKAAADHELERLTPCPAERWSPLI